MSRNEQHGDKGKDEPLTWRLTVIILFLMKILAGAAVDRKQEFIVLK